ncbi:ABC-2 type transport system ATP-binding protein [Variovorax sp. OAS795]|uniref:ATP-binding cassette domain-containing protein n=1 Tax=Variovorax sp. OAS795 TaxID=3034231 RepID=UPI003392752A
MHATGPAVAARSLHKRFVAKASKQVVRALGGVSLDVAAGTLTALVGPDGAGKTTLLRLMAGLMRADEGELRVLGIDVSADPQAVQDRISYMPQRFGLYEDLSVQENLDLYADLHGVSAGKRRERYARLMEMTDLGRFTARPAGKLSGGMKQKLGLACALVRSPDLLLLDEPTVGVDPLSRRELWQIVQQLVDDEKLSVIVSTAYLDEAERCSQVFVLQEGQLIAEGTPAEIRGRAEGLCFVATPPAGEAPRWMQARLLDAHQDIVDAVPHGGEVHFIRRQGATDAALAALLAGARAEPVPPRLEDGFMMLLRTQRGAPTDMAPAAPPGPATAKGQPGEIVIEVKDLVRRFGDFVAVASTSFSVRRGEIFGLLGPNGAGKTTTFRMLCGLLPASGGQLRVAGVDLRHARAQARQRIGYVSQKFALYGNLTVRENLSFFGGAYGLRGDRLRERMDTVLRQFDLGRELDAPSGQLPGGYKQRLAMATGLLHEPEILFLDEPTSGADPLARREFWRRITALAEGGTTIVITTHFMEEAEYCDRIVIQDAGKVLAIGTPREVRLQALDGEEGERRIDMEQAFIGIVEKARTQGRKSSTQAKAVQ